jgi:hypothetical protein
MSTSHKVDYQHEVKVSDWGKFPLNYFHFRQITTTTTTTTVLLLLLLNVINDLSPWYGMVCSQVEL